MFKTLGPGLLVDDYRGIIHDSTTQIHTIYRISRGWSHPWESLKKPVSGPRYLADQRVQRVQRKVRLGVTAVEVRYRLPWRLFFGFDPCLGKCCIFLQVTQCLLSLPFWWWRDGRGANQWVLILRSTPALRTSTSEALQHRMESSSLTLFEWRSQCRLCRRHCLNH